MDSMSDFAADVRHKIDLSTWPRAAEFAFFKDFTEPYHGVCVRVDCTAAYHFAKRNKLSVFLCFLHRALVASHQVENFRLRLDHGEVWLYETIHGGSAVGRPDGTIGFAVYPFHANVAEFVNAAAPEVERVRQRHDIERFPHPNVIRFSTLPWLDFTSLSHARNFAFEDSAPRITFGKMTEAAGRRTMPVSLHVHHALVDGLHVGQFFEHFQQLLDAPE